MAEHATNPKYKDSLFRMLFSEKKELLSLYNAVRGTSYTNVDDLEVNTLEGIIYLGMRNDISFVIGGELSLYEHQSTWCGNIPLRNLLYVSDIYAGITSKGNIFGSKTLELPRPKFVVFYNGPKGIPDRSVQKLSDAYKNVSEELKRIEPEHLECEKELELVVTVLNINIGHNEELMNNCKLLREYAIYVDKVRTYSKKMPVKDAVERAIKECIEDDVLAEYLRKHRMEVEHMSIYEFNQELYEKGVREDGRDEGRVEGEAIAVISQIRKKLEKKLSLSEIADMLELEVDYVEKVVQLIEGFPQKDDMEIAETLLIRKLITN